MIQDIMYVICGLGNPGEEYTASRHNIGREIVEALASAQDIEIVLESKKNALVGEGKIGKEKIMVVLPETFMNRSGNAVGKVVKSKKAAEMLVVVHDDLDLPLGKLRIVFGRGSGGHKGVESVKRAIKTNEFVRVRVGIAKSLPARRAQAGTPKGKVKKPIGEASVQKFVLGKWSTAEEKEIKKIKKQAVEALEVLVKEGRARAMNEFN